MKKVTFFAALISICLNSVVLAEEIKQEMNQAYQSFKDLQRYLVDSKAFEDPKNQKTVFKLIQGLHSSFKEVKEAASSDYMDDPGFKANVAAILDVISDAQSRYQSKDFEWSRFQLKNVSANCISCHASYATDIKFYGNNEKIDSLSLEDQGEFYLATRQFELAKNVYYKMAMNADQPYKRLAALKHWLLIYTRIDPNPGQIYNLLLAISKKKELYPYEKETIADWLVSISAWKKAPIDRDPVVAAEKILAGALQQKEPFYASVGTIELLRASSLLHQALNTGKLSSASRRKALYMLGFTYTKLPGYFIDELPDIFLISCIRGYPNTPEAKKAYQLYAEMVRGENTGSSGMHMPAELWAKFKELHDIAYGMPTGQL